MPIPRFHLRTLLIVVAILAVIVDLERRREFFLSLAAQHSRLSNEEFLAGSLVQSRHHFVLSTPERAMVDAHERLGAYHSKLRAKYERAARYPWLPVPPDPPEPKRLPE